MTWVIVLALAAGAADPCEDLRTRDAVFLTPRACLAAPADDRTGAKCAENAQSITELDVIFATPLRPSRLCGSPLRLKSAAAAVVGSADWPVEEPQPDRWLAEDKFRHFFMSLAAASLSYGAVRLAGVEDGVALAAAGVAAGGAGVWKEWRDTRVPGETASAKDLVWDAAGVAAGLALAAATR